MDSQRRKWFIPCNNPHEHGLTHEYIKSVLSEQKSIKYWVMADEVGLEEKTPHTHIVIYSESPIRHSTMRRFLYPSQFLMYRDKIEKVRLEVKEELYRKVFRELSVTYIFGKPNTGKTRYVLEKYGYDKVCHIANYRNPMNFDKYNSGAHEVLCFDEYASQIPIQDMNSYLDGYPLTLPCRYSDKVACYTVVYIISNIDLRLQYRDIREHNRNTWDAFIRRIHNN